MNIAVYTLLLINFFYVCLLPTIFFEKDGILNYKWWLTAMPFILQIGILVAEISGLIHPSRSYLHQITPIISIITIILSSTSIGLISYTIGVHTIPISLWHQENDKPKQLVTWGAYKHIRHPFYLSFLIAFAASFINCPHFYSLLTFLWTIIALNITAEREEKRFCSSKFGSFYKHYMSHTGRFFPIGGAI